MSDMEERKDTVQKEFIAFPDIAADTINVLLYQGEEVVKAENLWPGPTETLYQGRKRLRDQYEDLCKYELSDGSIRLMYLIANQTATDGKMLLRKAGYTGGAYREQYEGKIEDAFPVIEFVLYWGKARWRSSRDIRDFFARRELSEKEWMYVDGIKLHVYEMRHLPEGIRTLFQSDMRIVADYLSEGIGYRSERKIVHKAALIRMIEVLSGETDTKDVEGWLESQGIGEEDEITVCELFDQYERKGKQEGLEIGRREGLMIGKQEGLTIGRQEGLTIGRQEGLTIGARQLVMDIENAMKFFKVTLEKACEGLGTTVERYEAAKKLL